jgi:hypothetical protein
MTAIFPKLPGLKAEREIGLEFSTVIHRAASGRRAAMAQRFFPVHQFKLKYEFLRAKPSALEMQTLRGFFQARRGPLEPFFLQDPDRCVVTAQTVGVGAAGQITYPLVYSEGGAVDRIGGVDTTGSAPVALVAGAVAAASWTRNQLVLDAAAPEGAVVAWSGRYFFHVAFVDDSLTFKRFLALLYSADGVALETVNHHA